MPELIEKHALLKKVYEHPQERERMTDGEWCRKCIYEAPKVEAEPVRHGRWIQCDALDYKDPNEVIHAHGMCSGCKLIYDFRDETSRFKICPNCGARMDGGKGGADNDKT